jgi:hypothetical protein
LKTDLFSLTNMLVLSTLFLVLTIFHINAQSRDDVNSAIIRVRRYLQQSSRLANDETKWVQNSGKIGAGYDIITGSPVCYTGSCQMEGFRRPVFKLNVTKSPDGSCTSQLIPQNVDLDCLPSTQITANTESISTLDELKESTSRGIEVSASISSFGNSFSFSHSSETRSMINTIVQLNSSVCFTRAAITWVRLSAFEPLMELSDQFRYVIDNMPCCNQSDGLDQYIQEFIISYFGLAYVKDLLLGGFAQQKVVISQENKKNLRENGFTNTDRAELSVAAGALFSASTKLAMTEKYDQTKLNVFTKYSQQTSAITLGGSTNLQSIEEWSKTVPSNPIIVKFGISSILDLLTAKRFPKDTEIASKRRLLEISQERYMLSSLYCEKNCSQHGRCEPTGYFGLGQCLCDCGWIDKGCSTNATALVGLLTDAKVVGAMWEYIHNGVVMNNQGGNGAFDQPYGNSPKPYIDITFQGGRGAYLLIAVVDGVMREMATCGIDGSSLAPTTWASQNGWVVTGKRIMKYFVV